MRQQNGLLRVAVNLLLLAAQLALFGVLGFLQIDTNLLPKTTWRQLITRKHLSRHKLRAF